MVVITAKTVQYFLKFGLKRLIPKRMIPAMVSNPVKNGVKLAYPTGVKSKK